MTKQADPIRVAVETKVACSNCNSGAVIDPLQSGTIELITAGAIPECTPLQNRRYKGRVYWRGVTATGIRNDTE